MALERNMTILRRMNEILDLNTLTLMIIINNKESPSSTGCSSKPSLLKSKIMFLQFLQEQLFG